MRVGTSRYWPAFLNTLYDRLIMVLQVIDVASSAHEAFYAADCPSSNNSIMSFVTGSGTACDPTAAYYGE